MKKVAIIKTFIGIDVSKQTLDIFSTSGDHRSSKAFKIENTKEALVKLERELKRAGIILNGTTAVIFEHTGVYSKVLIDFLCNRKSKIFIESGLRIKNSIGILRGKSDKIDAKRIADFGMRHYDKLKCWEPPRPIIILIKQLLVNRERLKKNLNYFEVHLKEFTKFSSNETKKELTQINKPAVQGLQQSIAEVKKRIQQSIRKDSQVNHCYKLLTSIPGIGDITALYLITATNEFKRHTDAKTLACYCGVAPFEHSSGISVKKRTRVNPASNRKIKSLLHLAALQTIKKKGRFRKYYDAKVKAGKHKLSVINAIRNKLVIRIAAVIKRDSPYMTEQAYKKQLVTR